MNSLKQLLKQPLREQKTSRVVFFLIIALIGFADSVYLTIEHYRGVIPPCTIVEGCDVVLSSPYSEFYGIPTALFGAIYYLILLTGAFIYLESRHGRGMTEAHHAAILKYTFLFTVVGLGMSLWFIYLQVFILGSYCLYCLGSAATSTILFVMAMELLSKGLVREPAK